MLRLHRALALATLLTLGGCGATALRSPFGGGPQGESSIRIEVRNFNFADATVHAVRGVERIRLGVVTGKTDRTFDLAWPRTRTLQVDIDLLGGVRCSIPPRDVSPGEIIRIGIPVELHSDPGCA